MKVKVIIERHTYLRNQVFDKKPKDRLEKDIKLFLEFEEKEFREMKA